MFVNSKRWLQCILPRCWYLPNKLHGVTFRSSVIVSFWVFFQYICICFTGVTDKLSIPHIQLVGSSETSLRIYKMLGSSETLLLLWQNTSYHICLENNIHKVVIMDIQFGYFCSVCLKKRLGRRTYIPGRRTYIPGQCLSIDSLRILAGCRVVHKIGSLCRSYQYGIIVLSATQSYPNNIITLDAA